jgi:mono/diheme cytochrome c family protein
MNDLRNSLSHGKRPLVSLLVVLIAMAGLSACNAMRDQPRYDPLEASQFFTNGMSSRPLVPGAIPISRNVDQDVLYTGKTPDGQLVASLPISVTQQVLQRGQEEFNIYCSPCHGYDGEGQGMIVQRGFASPPSFHTQRLREAPVGHFFDVITNGFGQMYAYDYRVKPADRWAIIAYIRALQLSQNATTQDVPPDELQKLQAQP